MIRLSTRTLLGLLGFLVLLTLPAVADAPELTILKARFDFGKKLDRDEILLRASFDPDLLPEGYAPEADGLSVTIGPVTVTSLPPLDARSRAKTAKNGVFRHRMKRTKVHPDSLRLMFDPNRGLLKLTALRQDLRELRGEGREDVAFRLTAGDVVFSTTITLGQKDSRWRYRYSGRNIEFTPPPYNPPGEEPEIPPGERLLPFRVLRQMDEPGKDVFTTQVLRDADSARAAILERFGELPTGGGGKGLLSDLPYVLPVDFDKEMLIFIDLGRRYSCGYAIDVTKVLAGPSGVTVHWEELYPGAGCYTGPVGPNYGCRPFILIAVERHPGPVRYTGRAREWQCE